jgi:HD-GYP domain-containing protein (c-di-GMP phosphodiesterase class II)
VQIDRRLKFWLTLLLGLSLPGIAWIVYLDGGTSAGSIHLFYVPIITAAIFLGDIAGISVAIVSALFTLFIPHDVRTGMPTPLQDVVILASFFYGISVLSARLSARFQMRAAELASLLEVSHTISGALRLDEVLNTVAQKAAEILNVRGCVILLLDESGKNLQLGASWALSQTYLEKYPLSIANSRLDQQCLKGKAVAVLDAGSDPMFPHAEKAIEEGLVSVLCVPLIKAEQTMGVIRLYTDRRHKFTASEHRLVWGFASIASIAIENVRLYDNIRKNYWETVRALTRSMEAKDPYMLGHAERVTSYSLRLAQQLKLSAQEIEALQFGAILHDIGKISVADHLVASHITASVSEETLIHLHPLVGKSIVEPVEFLRDAGKVIASHHERWDGTGYPEGLAGEQIPLLARIAAIANVFDHLITSSPDRPGLSREEALHSLREQAGTAFDPSLVEVFISSFGEETAGVAAEAS